MAVIGASYLTFDVLSPMQEAAAAKPDYDPSAFWLYPDWDGPLKEPFWMRPPKYPEAKPAATAYGHGMYMMDSQTSIHNCHICENRRYG